MNRWIKILFTTGVLGFAFNVSAQFTEADFLKAEGTVLKNQIGDTINLRGTNLGSWLSLEYWMMPLGKGAISREGWAATASSTVEGSDIQSALDRDLSTGWTSAENQNGEQYFLVDMQQDRIFNRVSFEAGDFEDNYVRDYTIEVSSNLSYWQTASTGTASSGSTFVQLPNIYNARYIRITANSSVDFPWSIAEFNVFMEDDYHIRNALYDRFGVYRADTILDHFQDAWIQVSDLDRIKEMGMNMVRVPFYWMEIMNNDGTMKEHGFKQLDWVIEECTERELYVILDLHGGPGGWNGFITSGQAQTNEIYTNTEYQQMAKDLWAAVSERYFGNPTIAMYDLMNEPLSPNQTLYPIHALYDTLYQVVRAVDPDHVISIGAFPNFSFVVGPEYYGWENVLYQAHHYNEDKTNYASQSGFIDWALRDMASYQHNWNVPVLAGEFNFWSFTDLWEKYLAGANDLNISWSNWAYKNRRTDQPVENWGYYDNNSGAAPDLLYGTAEEIVETWSQFTTETFRENTQLISAVTAHTETAISKPTVGKFIRMKAYNGNYLSYSATDQQLTISSSQPGARAWFQLVDAGDGLVALKTLDDQYVSVQTDGNSMTANSSVIGEAEQFTFINLGNGRMALEGMQDFFVSAENGSLPVACNRTYIDGYEIFEWEEVSNLVLGFEKNEMVIFYPNPATNKITISADCTDSTLHIIDQSGRTVAEYTHVLKGQTIDLEGVSSGIYFLRLKDGKMIQIDKLIIQK